MTLPSPVLVYEAAERLRAVVRRTPLRRSEGLSRIVGGDVYLKLENEQITGSFKLRGAYNAIATLPPAVAQRGVVSASAGNHGLGLAYAAGLLGIPATVFVPHSAPLVKQDGIARLGATVNAEAHNYDDAEARAKAFAAEQELTYVSPCAGDTLLAGQGTVAVEILDELPTLGTIVAAVSGGGLIGGLAAHLRTAAPTVRIVGAQSERTAAMALSLAAGHVVEIPDEPTLADGLAGQIDATALAIGQAAIDEIALVSEEAIAHAIAWLWREEGVRAEGAGAVATAAVLTGRVTSQAPIAIVVSGGNIDAEKHARAVAEYGDVR